jgi:hypothetical protein
VKPVNKDGGRLPRCNPGDWCSSWSKHPIRDTRLSEGLSANHAVGQAWMWSASMQLARKDGAGGKLNSRGNVVIDCPPLCATTVFPRLFFLSVCLPSISPATPRLLYLELLRKHILQSSAYHPADRRNGNGDIIHVHPAPPSKPARTQPIPPPRPRRIRYCLLSRAH